MASPRRLVALYILTGLSTRIVSVCDALSKVDKTKGPAVCGRAFNIASSDDLVLLDLAIQSYAGIIFVPLQPLKHLPKPESTEGGRRVSILKWPEGALLNLG